MAQKEPYQGLQAPRRARPVQLPHDQGEVKGTGVNQVPLPDVLSSTKQGPAHPSAIEQMCEAPFKNLGPLSVQSLGLLPFHPAPVPVDSLLFFLLPFPLPSSSIRFRNVRPDVHFLEIHKNLSAVISLVGNAFFKNALCVLRDLFNRDQVLTDKLRRMRRVIGGLEID